MRWKHLVVVLLVLTVITLSSCSKPYEIVVEKGQAETKGVEMETHSFIQEMYYFMGDWKPAGSNPSFVIRDTTGNNIFEVDHSHRGLMSGNLSVNDTLIFNESVTASCPKIYNNGSSCVVIEGCGGSMVVVC